MIGDVEEADPPVERVADDLGESPHAQAGLVTGLSEPTLPVPIPTSETWTPDLPRVTFSVGPLGRLFLERPVPAMAVEAVAASAAAAVACAMNSRRFRGGFMQLFSPVSEVS